MRLQVLLPLLALQLATLCSHAQTYEPGLLVRSTGDTLRGELENDFWVEPPAFIRYRATPGSASQLFQPRQLRAVSFTDGRYFSYETFAIDHAAETRLDLLPQGNVANVQVDSMLAEVLVAGPATLFRVVLPSATHYLVRRPDKPALDLSARLYLSNVSRGSRAYADGNNYRGQLGVYFGDCLAANIAAQTAAFTPNGLGDVVQAYNQACNSVSKASRNLLPQAAPRRQVAFVGGILAGVRYNYIESSYPTSTCIDCKLHPFAGLYAELLAPGRTTAVYGELSSSTFRSQGLRLNQYTYNTFNYQALLHTARLGVRFFFNLPREQHWLLGLGYELNAISNRSGIPSGTAPDILINQKTTYATTGIIPDISMGWRSKRVTITVDGQYYSSFLDVSQSQSSGTQFSMRTGLSYRLGRNPDAARPAAARQ